MRIDDLITKLDLRGQKLIDMLSNCRDDPNADNVHDLRVSIRRYVAASDVLALLAKERIAPKSLRPLLKEILDSYDRLRDFDVMLADLGAESAIFNENSPFFMDLERQERELRDNGVATISNEQVAKISKLLVKTNQRARQMLRSTTSKQINRTLDIVFKKCREFAAKVNEHKPATIHKLRVPFKKFRYCLDIFSSNLPEPPADLFKRIRAYQTSLGLVQDASVLIEVMDQFEKNNPGMISLAERQFAQDRLRTRVEAFMVILPNLDHFWRANKRKQPPWFNQPSNEDLRGFIEKMKRL